MKLKRVQMKIVEIIKYKYTETKSCCNCTFEPLADKCIRGLSRSHFFSSHRYRNKCDVIISLLTHCEQKEELFADPLCDLVMSALFYRSGDVIVAPETSSLNFLCLIYFVMKLFYYHIAAYSLINTFNAECLNRNCSVVFLSC